jgi:hypothetical protein
MSISSGFVAAGFEPMREAFERDFEDDLELGASFAAYVGDELVVDLVSGWTDRKKETAWDARTLCPVLPRHPRRQAIITTHRWRTRSAASADEVGSPIRSSAVARPPRLVRKRRFVIMDFDPFSGKALDTLELVWEPCVNKFRMAPPLVVCCVSQNATVSVSVMRRPSRCSLGGTPVDSSWRTREWILARCNTTSATSPSNTPSATPNCRRSASRTSGETDLWWNAPRLPAAVDRRGDGGVLCREIILAFTVSASKTVHLRPIRGETAMATKRQSNVQRRSGKDRRLGADTRTQEEKMAVGERRAGTDRRSGLDRRSGTPGNTHRD